MSIVNSKLSGTGGVAKDQLSNSVKLLLLWLAASDGDVDPSELEFADEHLPEADEVISTDELLGVIRSAKLFHIEKALRILSKESRELRAAFMDMAIAMSMADREIAFTENHLLRFYADALFLGSDTLHKRFRSVTGRDLTDPGDPGQADWWQGASDAPAIELASSSPTRDIIEARTLLALSPDADLEEVERKYIELKRIFESDRVATMGSAAMQLAAKRLKRIEDAYQLMRKELGGEAA